MHVIAAKAVALGEALSPSFASYAAAVVENARVLAETLAQAGLAIVSGGTDTHLMLVDLRPLGLTGRDAEISLERAGITCNKNGIPFDPEKPTITSGVRLGSPAATSRGFGAEEFRTSRRNDYRRAGRPSARPCRQWFGRSPSARGRTRALRAVSDLSKLGCLAAR